MAKVKNPKNLYIYSLDKTDNIISTMVRKDVILTRDKRIVERRDKQHNLDYGVYKDTNNLDKVTETVYKLEYITLDKNSDLEIFKDRVKKYYMEEDLVLSEQLQELRKNMVNVLKNIDDLSK